MTQGKGAKPAASRSVSSAAAQPASRGGLADMIEAMRSIQHRTPPVIFTSPMWNGFQHRCEETGDMAIGNDTLALISLACDREAEPTDPRKLTNHLNGVEIVEVERVLSLPNHRLFPRACAMARSLLAVALADRNDSEDRTEAEGEAHIPPPPKE